MSPRPPAIALALLSLAAAAEAATNIDHKAVGCVVAERFPRLEVRLSPADDVGRARILFRAEGTADWYAVVLKRSGDVFAGVLPKPKKTLQRFDYYVEVVDKALDTSRTQEYGARVAGAADACGKEMIAATVASASLVLETVSGASAIPAGFSSAGIAGAPAAGASAAAAAGGIGAKTVVLAGTGVLAAGAAVAVAASSGGDDSGGQAGPVAQVSGQVFGNFDPNPANPTGPGLYSNPVVGAVVSTSLDAVTTTTDGAGRFSLVTQTRLPRTTGCTAFTLTVRANGYPTYSLAQNWVGPGKVISLVPPQPNAASLSPCIP